ncbi:MAG: hypothetical protein LBB13_03950 [Rickettsiales bacterium]|jgi:hypothetical protein|nr:hypothetical protein [Rickettsiales bacterium]
MGESRPLQKKRNILRLGYCIAIILLLLREGVVIYSRWKVKKLKVDIVYLWSDDGDFAPLKKGQTAATEAEEAKKNKPNSRSKFNSSERLKFSLRSLEKYAPWINHLFIVTNSHVPSWLNTKSGKITVVSQSQIMPKKHKSSSPFSFSAVEFYLHKIPSLSEHFLYANDDMFFGSKVNPWFFFDRKSNPVIRGFKIIGFSKKKKNLEEYVKNTNKIYNQTIFYSLNLVMKKFKNAPDIFPHHNIDAYRKSYVEDTLLTFKKEYDYTFSHSSRRKSTLQRIIISYVDYAKKRGTIKYVRPKYSPLLRKFHFLTKCQDSLHRSLTYFNAKNTEQFKKFEKEKSWLRQEKFPLFCFSDDSESSETDRREASKFLGELFPKKSSFEK